MYFPNKFDNCYHIIHVRNFLLLYAINLAAIISRPLPNLSNNRLFHFIYQFFKLPSSNKYSTFNSHSRFLGSANNEDSSRKSLGVDLKRWLVCSPVVVFSIM